MPFLLMFSLYISIIEKIRLLVVKRKMKAKKSNKTGGRDLTKPMTYPLN